MLVGMEVGRGRGSQSGGGGGGGRSLIRKDPDFRQGPLVLKFTLAESAVHYDTWNRIHNSTSREREREHGK